MYVCGDVHSHLVEQDFYSQLSFLRVRKDGGTDEPPLFLVSNPTLDANASTLDVFGVSRFWNDTIHNVTYYGPKV
jgi:hypothetical protein